MPEFKALNPDYERFVRDSISAMPAARLFGFELTRVAPGECELVQPYREELSQGTGLFLGGVIGVLADFCGGAAAASLLPPGWAFVTVDYTTKLLAPGLGEKLVARGQVVRPGKSMTVSSVNVFAVRRAQEALCCIALVTMRNVKLSSLADAVTTASEDTRASEHT